MKSAVVDVTSLAGIESLRRGSVRDPWAARLAGNLADLFIFSDEVLYPYPQASNARELAQTPGLELVTRLTHRDSASFSPLPYSTDAVESVAPEHLEDCLEKFMYWCAANPYRADQWMTLHQESWVSGWHADRFPHRYSFDVDQLLGRPDIEVQAEKLRIPVPVLLYTLDVVLRYPMLGRIAGDSRPYLNHPIRDSIALPTFTMSAEKPQSMGALSFSSTIEAMAPKLTLDEYAVLLHELRGLVRQFGIHRVKPGHVELEVVREIAHRVALPAHLGNSERRIGMAAALAGGTAALPVAGPIGPIVGIAVSIAQYYWTGSLPRSASRVGWLKWALSWDIESQVQD